MKEGRPVTTGKRATGMRRLVTADNGLNIFGQGIRIMLLTAPAAAGSPLLHGWVSRHRPTRGRSSPST